jgi:hypothetical protein
MDQLREHREVCLDAIHLFRLPGDSDEGKRVTVCGA